MKEQEEYKSCTAFVTRCIDFEEEHLKKNPEIKTVRISEGIVLIDGTDAQKSKVEDYNSVIKLRFNKMGFRSYIPE